MTSDSGLGALSDGCSCSIGRTIKMAAWRLNGSLTVEGRTYYQEVMGSIPGRVTMLVTTWVGRFL